MKLRAHHIVCLCFLKFSLTERGEKFLRMENKIKETMGKGSEEIVEVVLGVDDLCYACPLCRDDRCQSPEGDEDSCRKWDAILLKGLGVPLGNVMPAHAWRTLIERVFPMDFCQKRCLQRSFCEGSRAN